MRISDWSSDVCSSDLSFARSAKDTLPAGLSGTTWNPGVSGHATAWRRLDRHPEPASRNPNEPSFPAVRRPPGLHRHRRGAATGTAGAAGDAAAGPSGPAAADAAAAGAAGPAEQPHEPDRAASHRSEERRLGKESVTPRRS